jgi:hypothetical protein
MGVSLHYMLFSSCLCFTRESVVFFKFPITSHSPRNVSSLLIFFSLSSPLPSSSDVDTSSAGAGIGSYSLGESELLRTKFIKTLEVLSDNQREMQNEMRSNNDLKKHIVVLEAQARRHRR